MFEKILIANRGEIACRVIRTARRLGVTTVAIYSDADRNALHVRMADEAVRIGTAPAAESYLDGEAVIAAAKATGAQAIHPGYGFLSENPDFVEAVAAAGLTFVGPPAAAIRAMGLKDAAKRLMEKAGVPVVPGYHGVDQDAGLLRAWAGQIGYPVMIKARAGGGGKGMRQVEDAADFDSALASARREAAAAFGDDAVLIEKFVAAPRHIEVQIFGDTHGTVVHLFERDCSLQRRHQKVIEEAPAPGMTEAVRAAMTSAAVTAARSIGYVGAGTVEFIVDGSGALRPDGFWFMEMNTRLQVEHPVTEAVTGIDLVEWQLHVAAGAPLPRAQEAIALDGHAMEARIYAEDPMTGFLPSTGRIGTLRFGPGRVDAGVAAGDAVTAHYDPMIAKLIAHGTDREAARRALRAGLRGTVLAGPRTNVDFLVRLTGDAAFCAGTPNTGTIARGGDELIAPRIDGLVDALALLASALPPGVGLPWRLWGGARSRARLHTPEGRPVAGEVTIHRSGEATVEVEGKPVLAATELRRFDDGLTLVVGDVRHRVAIESVEGGVLIGLGEDRRLYLRPDPLNVSAAAAATGNEVTAPMTGLVRTVSVAPGDVVRAGDALGAMEAMKMEYTLTAPRDGTLAEVRCAAGSQVEGGAVLFRLEPREEEG